MSTQAASFLALGDSYTIGESVTEANRWPVRLSKGLNDNGIVIEKPTIVATTGWKTFELQAALEEQEKDLAPHYDLVSLLIGVNNQYRKFPLDLYRKEFTELLHYSINKCKRGHEATFVVSIPDYAFTPFGVKENRPEISEEIDAYNTIARDICAGLNVAFIDITPISRFGLVQPELVAGDGLHPSGEQYRRWVELILPRVEQLIV